MNDLEAPYRPTFSIHEFNYPKKGVNTKYLPDTHMYFAMGRDALYAACELLGITKNHNILLPEYICDTALIPFIKQDIEVRFYQLNDDLTLNKNHAASLCDKNTKAIIAVNYFGIPANLIPFHEFKESRKILLIEDNAQGLFSRDDEDLLGMRADLGIFSFNKTVSLPSGAAVWVKPHFLNPNVGKNWPRASLVSELKYCFYGLLSNPISPLLEEEAESAEDFEEDDDYDVDNESYDLFVNKEKFDLRLKEYFPRRIGILSRFFTALCHL